MSETTRNMRRREECRVAAEGAAPAPREQAGRAASVAFVCGLRGEKPTRTAAGLSREELLAVVEGDEASRAVQIALVSRLDDAELLIDIALNAARIPARRRAPARRRVPSKEVSMSQNTRTAFIRQMLEDREAIAPSPDFSYKARLKSRRDYDELYRRSLEDPEGFWAEAADEQLDWFRRWDKVGGAGFAEDGSCARIRRSRAAANPS